MPPKRIIKPTAKAIAASKPSRQSKVKAKVETPPVRTLILLRKKQPKGNDNEDVKEDSRSDAEDVVESSGEESAVVVEVPVKPAKGKTVKRGRVSLEAAQQGTPKKKRIAETTPERTKVPIEDEDNPMYTPRTSAAIKKFAGVYISAKAKSRSILAKNVKTQESEDEGSDSGGLIDDIAEEASGDGSEGDSVEEEEAVELDDDAPDECQITTPSFNQDRMLRGTYNNLPNLRFPLSKLNDVKTFNLGNYCRDYEFNNSYKKQLVELLTKSSLDFFLSNLARSSPASFREHAYSGSKDHIITSLGRGDDATRIGCVSFGLVDRSSLTKAKAMGKDGPWSIKTLALNPIEHEWERTIACIDMIYKKGYKVPTYAGAINFSTIPIKSESDKSFREVAPGLYSSSTLRQDSAEEGTFVSDYLHPLLLSKNALYASEDVPMYNATKYFKKGAPKVPFTLASLSDCPLHPKEFKSGDLVGVIYTTSVYAEDRYSFNIVATFLIHSPPSI
ncbi:hypothetical protein QCA50_010967 [Cerrena zonata]|uniref:Uncharacterized protein n=1 Tax=Cerrena zonata TaxID=2478898 RepID=A0AAW0G6M8_9APHY